MIGRVRGRLAEATEQGALIDVGGVGYEVELTTGGRAALPEVGEELALHTHFLVREDAQQLYGFAIRPERDVFRALLRLPGVGPKLALAVLSTFKLDELARAAADGDAARLTRVQGIGRKTAERMLVDLKDRLDAFNLKPAAEPPRADGATREAERALVSLGYRPQQAARLVAEVDGDAASTEQLVREALRLATAARQANAS